MYHSFEIVNLGFVAIKSPTQVLAIQRLVKNKIPEDKIKFLGSDNSWKKIAVDWTPLNSPHNIYKLSNKDKLCLYTIKSGKLYTEANLNRPTQSVWVMGVMDCLFPEVIGSAVDIRKNAEGVYFSRYGSPDMDSDTLKESLEKGYSVVLDPPIELSPEEIQAEHICYWFGNKWLENAKLAGFEFKFPDNARLEDYEGKGFLWVGLQDVVILRVLDWMRVLVDHVILSEIDWPVSERKLLEKLLVSAYPDELEVQAAVYVLTNYDRKEQTKYLDWIAQINRSNGYPLPTTAELENAILTFIANHKKV